MGATMMMMKAILISGSTKKRAVEEYERRGLYLSLIL
jgi:hypothetical protein